jgi:Undecaprenyl-phosphate galactose phosphotransferase WbaP
MRAWYYHRSYCARWGLCVVQNRAGAAFPNVGAGRVLQSETSWRSPLRFREFQLVSLIIFLSHCTAIELALQVGIAVHDFATELGTPGVGGSFLGGLPFVLLSVPCLFLLVGLIPGYGLNRYERLRQHIKLLALIFAVLIAWNSVAEGLEDIIAGHIVETDLDAEGSGSPDDGDYHWPPAILILTLLAAMLLLPLTEAIVRRFLERFRIWGRPTIVLGGGQSGASVIKRILGEPGLGYVPVGVLDDDASTWSTEVAGVPVLGPTSEAGAYSKKAAVAIVAQSAFEPQELADLVHQLPYRRIQVVPDLYGMQSLWVTPRDLDGILALEVSCNLKRRYNRIVKRGMDLVLAWLFLNLSLPVIAVCALLVKLSDGGPAFFTQIREGYRGREIKVYKLRTMSIDAEERLASLLRHDPAACREWDSCMKLRNDPRILPGIGRFMRRYSLDELPQLWHVICGDMSLVGPRPFPSYHMARFDAAFSRLRRSVHPGVTGLWQVSGRSDGDLLSQRELDTYYIRNWSPWLDIHILFRSVLAVVRAHGAM